MVQFPLLTSIVDKMLRYPQPKHNKITLFEAPVGNGKWFLAVLWELVEVLGVGWGFVGEQPEKPIPFTAKGAKDGRKGRKGKAEGR